MGGYIDIGNSRCTGTFDFRDYNENYFEVAARTARHCSSEKIDGATKAKIQVYLGAGYSEIEVIDDLALRRKRVQELALDAQGGVAVTPLPESSGKTPQRPSRLSPDEKYGSGRVINGSDEDDFT